MPFLYGASLADAILLLFMKSFGKHLSPVLNHTLYGGRDRGWYFEDCCVPSTKYNVWHRE